MVTRLEGFEGDEAALWRQYDRQVRAWFGEVRPLRLEGSGRFFAPPPALPLRAVYVPPALSPTHLLPQAEPPPSGGSGDILEWLAEHRHLVILGDPGSGKSTLVSWLAWRLCAGLAEPLPDWCSDVLPVPMILRDMMLGQETGFDDLLRAFVRTEFIAAQPELREGLGPLLQQRIDSRGASLLFLIDGLDEVPAPARAAVGEAIRDGLRRLPDARFVVTSRIVGYDDAPIESMVRAHRGHESADARAAKGEPGEELLRLYVAPFDDERIRWFARNWFSYGESPDRRSEDYPRQFIDGVMRDPVALQLARTPNLLVMAAQVFGITNTLPDGRAKLYEAITKAYLESIDQRYRLADTRYSFEQKKAWLSSLGWRMQKRRDDAPGEARDLLVAETEVVQWLREAPEGLGVDDHYVRAFVDAIARRSGLFIPRGDRLYAFAHLSIQEYFAALHLQYRIRESALAEPEELERWFDELRAAAERPGWREALVTFFELPEWNQREVARLWQAAFGAQLALVPEAAERDRNWRPPRNSARVELLSRLAINPRVLLTPTQREQAFDRAWHYLSSERGTGLPGVASAVLPALTANADGSGRVWRRLAEESRAGNPPGELDLSGARFTDLSPLADPAFAQLRRLRLNAVPSADLAPLASLTSLEELSLRATMARDFTPLASLPRLRQLVLSDAAMNDLSTLAGLRALTYLSLDDTGVTSLAPLDGLAELHTLVLTRTRVADLSPLARLSNLGVLVLDRTAVSDLRPLADLKRLTQLKLDYTAVADLRPLSALVELAWLHLWATQVTDLQPLAALRKLRWLDLDETRVTDLSPLAGLDALATLHLSRTGVGDLRPLAGLVNLRKLTLNGTPITDASALDHLGQLVIEGVARPDRDEVTPAADSPPEKRRWWQFWQ